LPAVGPAYRGAVLTHVATVMIRKEGIVTERRKPIRQLFVLFTAMAMTLGMFATASANPDRGAQSATANVFGQGEDGPVVAEDGATLHRTHNGIQARLQMPTPEPGTYDYPSPGEPSAAEPGHPEVFTLWLFVFDDELGPFGDNPWSSAFHVAGHPVGGSNLTLSGQINTNTEPFAGFALEDPRDVEVHLAVAPHGGLDPQIMPEQIQTPAGGPGMWWFAIFD
jgi:hypothetical protein